MAQKRGFPIRERTASSSHISLWHSVALGRPGRSSQMIAEHNANAHSSLGPSNATRRTVCVHTGYTLKLHVRAQANV